MTAPEGLHERGAALWASLGQKAGTPAGDLALEASRTADRLDELDRIIHGKGVLNLLSFRLSLNFTEGDERTVNVKVDFADVMAEARQQQMAFKQMLSALGVEKGVKVEPERKASPLDELKNLRERRGKPAARSGGAPKSADRR